jgi:hypothetical protein
MEAEQPGVSAAVVFRRHNIARRIIFRWRMRFSVARASARNCQWCDSPMQSMPPADALTASANFVFALCTSWSAVMAMFERGNISYGYC